MTELTPAEQAAAAAVRDIGSWEYCNDEPDPRMAYREWLARLARDVVAAVRPILYREAADYVRQAHMEPVTAPMSGVLMAGIRSAAAVLEHRAAALARRDEETRGAH